MTRRLPRLATRLMTAQALVIAVGALTLLAATALIAPGLFHDHLAMTGEDSPAVVDHAEQAFASATAVSITLATLASLLAAGLVSWVIVRRVSRPVEDLATAAAAVAAGTYAIDVPDASFATELDDLEHGGHGGTVTQTQRARRRRTTNPKTRAIHSAAGAPPVLHE